MWQQNNDGQNQFAAHVLHCLWLSATFHVTVTTRGNRILNLIALALAKSGVACAEVDIDSIVRTMCLVLRYDESHA